MATAPSVHLCQAPPAALAATARLDHSQLAKIAVERTRMPMVVSDPRQPDQPIIFANQAFLDKTGYTADEVIGRNCRFLQGPATDPAAVARIRAAIRAEQDLTIELLNYRRDGSTFWNRLLLSPITGDDGELLYYFASQLDVTAERRARDLAEHEHILLREIDHRAKNALALVQGIVRLSNADDPATYSRTVQGRVDALARAHIILSEAQWHDVPLDRVVDAAATPFGPARTKRGGPAADIAAAHVQPLILAIHELLANAVAHGSLSVPSGEVAVRWSVDDGTLAIDVHERGGPPPAAPARAGYGLTMVDAFVRRQLHGSVERHWHCDGLRTRVAFPWAAARAAA